jgi:phage baseplate assembly protein W
MAGAIKTPVYKDFDLNMKMHPVTGKLLIRKNADSVKQAIKSLVLTDRGERPFRPLFGSDIKQRLFDLMDPSIETSIQYDIRTAVSTYEERANLLGVTVDGDPDSNNLKINIVFSTINSEAPASLTLTLEAIR